MLKGDVDVLLVKEMPDGEVLNVNKRPKCFKGDLKSLWNSYFLLYSFAAYLFDYLEDKIDEVYLDHLKNEK